VAKPIAFVTHISPEKTLAIALATRIKRDFRNAVEPFVTSDPETLRPGDPWFENLSDKLRRCDIQILLLSRAALERPWVYFEAGAAWARDIRQIPLCHSGLRPGDLAMPLSKFQAGLLTDPGALRSLYRDLADKADQDPPDVDFEALASELAEVAAALPKPVEPVDLPPPAPPARFTPKQDRRFLVLTELRRLRVDESRTSAIVKLDIAGLAGRAGYSEADIQEALVDLLTLGLAESHNATQGTSAEKGAATITAAGQQELERLQELKEADVAGERAMTKLIDDRFREARRRERSRRAYSTGNTLHRSDD
jgi:hypothetical protein